MNKFKLMTLAVLFFTSLLIASTKPLAQKKFVNMETIKAMCKSIYTQVTSHLEKPAFSPDVIIALSRGGLIPLGFLSGEAMFNNRNVKIISIASYTDEGNQSDLKLLFPLTNEELQRLRNFGSILIVDDLVDSGKSLAWVASMLKNQLSHSNIKTAALFYKKGSIFKPDYYVEETEDWIVFPWEI